MQPAEPDSAGGDQATPSSPDAATGSARGVEASDDSRLSPHAIPGYTILRALASDTATPVFLARRELDNEPVVIKIPDFTAARTPSQRAHARWRAEQLARIHSPHVVRLTAVQLDHAPPYEVQEYLPAGSLQDRMWHMLPVDLLLNWFDQILQALEAVHAAHLVHLDVKPANLLFRDQETLVLLDFGIAARVGDYPPQLPGGAHSGTPVYMSPEHGQGERVDARSDLYSAGIVLHELLAGTPPFEGATAAQTVYKHLHEEVPLLPRAHRRLQGLIDGLLAKSPAERPATARDVRATLARLRRP